MRLGSEGNVLDYTAYAFTGGSSAPPVGAAGWITLWDFGRLYRQSAITGAAVNGAAALIASDSTVRATWQLNYVGGRPGQYPNNTNWHGYWCAIQNLEPATYAACAQAPAPTGP
jgi:hypothetical protein